VASNPYSTEVRATSTAVSLKQNFVIPFLINDRCGPRTPRGRAATLERAHLGTPRSCAQRGLISNPPARKRLLVSKGIVQGQVYHYEQRVSSLPPRNWLVFPPLPNFVPSRVTTVPAAPFRCGYCWLPVVDRCHRDDNTRLISASASYGGSPSSSQDGRLSTSACWTCTSPGADGHAWQLRIR
jgi:hypothetical protein